MTRCRDGGCRPSRSGESLHRHEPAQQCAVPLSHGHPPTEQALMSTLHVDPAPSAMSMLTDDLLLRMHAWWRAANYLSVGQIYLRANPLLEEPLRLEDVKPRLLGHWGTTPGLNLLYVHLNRMIKAHDLNMINIIGPGHGGP